MTDGAGQRKASKLIDKQIIKDLNQQPSVIVTPQSIDFEKKLLLVRNSLLHVI